MSHLYEVTMHYTSIAKRGLFHQSKEAYIVVTVESKVGLNSKLDLS